MKGTDATKVELEEDRQIEVLTQTSRNIELDLIRSNLEPIAEALLRRFGRVSCQPDREYGFLVWDGYPVELDENNKDSITYKDAMQRSDSDKWLDAIKFEMESMKINDVWTLVDPPTEVRSIECKQIFKRKRDTDGKVETYKVYLVVKGYRQHYGINYDKIFSPMALLSKLKYMF